MNGRQQLLCVEMRKTQGLEVIGIVIHDLRKLLVVVKPYDLTLPPDEGKQMYSVSGHSMMW